jgi:AhpD family alkylhydroperoxidase
MDKNYVADREHLEQQLDRLAEALPGPMAAFVELHEQAVVEGALATRVKELIALGISIAARCDGCIAYHVHDALQSGATREEILEAIGVAVLMGGGPAAVYGAQALEALEQFQAGGGPAGSHDGQTVPAG